MLETQRPTFKSDIYNVGVLLLELPTGKAPNQASLGKEGINLPQWEWKVEMFDMELVRYQNIEEEMVQVLQMAMACVETMSNAWPEIQKVMCMLNDVVNKGDGDDNLQKSSNKPSKDSYGGPTPFASTTP
ncbi:hypothetical protein Taro_024920 [Colocasia esculenta]|uniref:Uncharacterized protein n=1 Tax=Colocasia esculenta TaxID=4460 RepID=A0A843VCP2_COLES|nr:hypothetical protein [Colocasia esculenta]